MVQLRKGHLVRHRDDDRRRGIVESADVNRPGSMGLVVVCWRPSNRVTEISPHLLVLDDHPLRGRNVVAEHAVDDWMEDL